MLKRSTIGHVSASSYFDLNKSLQTDPEFVKKLYGITKDIQVAERNGAKDKVYALMADLLRLCNRNPSLLTPYFFPRYPRRDPMSLLSRPFAMAMMGPTFGGTLTIQASRQIGKCVSGDSTITVRANDGVISSLSMKDLFEKSKQNACSAL